MVSEPIELFGPKSMAVEKKPVIGMQKEQQEMKHTRKLRRLKYSCEEVYERMDNGLCIFCDELDTPGHHDLKHKGIQIFMVDDNLASDYIKEFHQSQETVTSPEPIVETAKNLDSFIEPLVHDSVSQALDSVPDMLMVHKVEELPQKSASGSGKKIAHQLFDQMPNEYQKDLTMIESSDKEVLSFSHKDDRVWEPGGLPTKMDLWNWKELKPYGESHKVKSNPEFNTFESNKTFSLEDEHDDETNAETNSLLEKERIHSRALCDQVPATQSQDFNVIQQEKLIHDTETIMEMGPVQEPESLGLTDSIFKVDYVPSQFQVPIPSLEPSCRRQKESLAVINDLSCDLGCVIGKTIGSICDSELGQDNSHDEEELIGLNLGKLLKNERLFSIICLLGLNDMSCWTQLLRQQIFPKSWRFKFKTESSGEAILLKQHDDSVETNLVKFERALNAVWIAKRCESSLLQYSSATQSRAPFSPYQSYNDQPYYERKFGECPEIEFDRESDEIKDVKLQDKQPKEDVKTLVMSENEQSLESVDDESFNDEKSGEIIAEGTAIELVDKSGYKVFREGNLNSLLLQEFHIVLLHFKESSDTIVPCRNRDTRVLSSHFFAGGVKLLSKMVCAFLLPFLTMNIDSRTICLNSRSIFVDDDTVALRRIVEDRFVPRMEEIYLESTKQNLEFATDRRWVELWINTQDFTLTNYGLRLSPSEYTKNTFLLVYHLSKHSVSCLFLNTSTGCIGALLMIYYAKMLIQLDAPTVFNDLLCKMRIVHGLGDLRQFTRVGIKFHLKHKWRSKFGSNKLTRTWTSYSRYDSSSCVLRQEKNYVMALFPIGEALTLVNDKHTLVAQKKGTETSTGCCYGFHVDLDLMADVTAGTADIPMDEFSSVCKLLFGVFVLNLIADQVRDWSFFGLLLQWKWHPPPQATSEFHQAHNDKPVFHL